MTAHTELGGVRWIYALKLRSTYALPIAFAVYAKSTLHDYSDSTLPGFGQFVYDLNTLNPRSQDFVDVLANSQYAESTLPGLSQYLDNSRYAESTLPGLCTFSW
jgi:hypothetical protein